MLVDWAMTCPSHCRSAGTDGRCPTEEDAGKVAQAQRKRPEASQPCMPYGVRKTRFILILFLPYCTRSRATAECLVSGLIKNSRAKFLKKLWLDSDHDHHVVFFRGHSQILNFPFGKQESALRQIMRGAATAPGLFV